MYRTLRGPASVTLVVTTRVAWFERARWLAAARSAVTGAHFGHGKQRMVKHSCFTLQLTACDCLACLVSRSRCPAADTGFRQPSEHPSMFQPTLQHDPIYILLISIYWRSKTSRRGLPIAPGWALTCTTSEKFLLRSKVCLSTASAYSAAETSRK